MQFRLFPTAQAPSQARAAVGPLAERIKPASVADVKAVVSELVTISVNHGASKPIDVAVTIEDDKLEGVVVDHGPGARAMVRARELTDTSLVLRVVSGLVEEWGTNDEQTRIWFRMAVVPLT